MADADVAITAGAGTKIDTRTVGAGTDEHRQVVVIGDPVTAASVLQVVAKGTQGSFGLPVQALNDAGRVATVFKSAAALAGSVTDALVSLTPARAHVDGGAANTHAITASKTFRATGLLCSVRASAAVASWARFTLRCNPSGAAIVTSPIVAHCEVGTPAQVIGSAAHLAVPLPDGLEFSGANQIAITQIAAATTVLLTVSLLGYEY